MNQSNAPEPVLGTIGDISLTAHQIYTPAGAYPLRGSTWTITDSSHVQERMSPIGIILCLFFIWLCFVGLLFLLMKERTVSGHIQVTVYGDGFHYSTLISPTIMTPEYALQMVNWARSLAAVA